MHAGFIFQTPLSLSSSTRELQYLLPPKGQQIMYCIEAFGKLIRKDATTVFSEFI